MKRRMISWLMAVCMLVLAIAPAGVVSAEELYFPEIELEVGKGEETRGEGDELGSLNNSNLGGIGALTQKDWAAAAASIQMTGAWREDIVNIARTQIGYSENSDGLTIYHDEDAEEPTDWTALFVNWVADQAGLNTKKFPRGNDYASLRTAMDKVHALKKISRTAYPTAGDLLLIDDGSHKLVGIVEYVANGYANVIHGDDHGKVTRTNHQLMTSSVKYYIDLNVLMERAGIEVGKGGNVPEIPEGGVAAWTNVNAVYMRSEPTTASKSLTTIKKAGTAVMVTSAEMQGDGYIWYGVTYNNKVGYIRGDLLNLDLSAIPTPTPVPVVTPAPTVTPVIPEITGCVTCANVADGVALPTECCYEHLRMLGSENANLFMAALAEADPLSRELYVKCHDAHVAAGAEAIILKGGFSAEERVVNIVVNQPANADGAVSGQNVTFAYEVVGATAYQWYQVKTVDVTVDGEPVQQEEVTKLVGETGTTLTVMADENTNGLRYYCVATVGDASFTVTSKPVTLSLASVIEAKAIIGEEVYFTYTYEGAVSYQWFVREPGADEFVALEGAAIPRLSLTAELEKSGVQYRCIAYGANGTELAKGSIYTYTVDTEDLTKYVEELAGMTRDERYAIMGENGAWNVQVNGKNLANEVRYFWMGNLQKEYPTLLCTGTSMLAPGENHGDQCPWDEASTSTTERNDADPCETHKGQLPAEMLCAYEFLRAMNAMEQYEYLNALQAKDADAYRALMTAYEEHVHKNPAILCTCQKGKLAANGKAMDMPGKGHTVGCPWRMMYVTSVLGYNAYLSIENPDESHSYTWSKLVNGQYVAIEGATKSFVEVSTTENETMYRCAITSENGTKTVYEYFSVSIETENMEDYLAFLFAKFNASNDMREYAAIAEYYINDLWNIVVGQEKAGEEIYLSMKVLESWQDEYKDYDYDVLCSCVVNNPDAHPEHKYMLPWDAEHDQTCPWFTGTDVADPDALRELADGSVITLAHPYWEGDVVYTWQMCVSPGADVPVWVPIEDAVTEENACKLTLTPAALACAYRCVVSDEEGEFDVGEPIYLGGEDYFNWCTSVEDEVSVAEWLQMDGNKMEYVFAALDAHEKQIALGEVIHVTTTADGRLCLMDLHGLTVLAEIDAEGNVIDTRYHIAVAKYDAATGAITALN